MRIHLVKKQTIEIFVRRNNQNKVSFQTWLTSIQLADWNKPNDMIFTFNSVDLLGKNSGRVVFNIGGNKYRMICRYHFGKKRIHLYVNWIGTHADYTKLCLEGKQYTVNDY